MSSSQATQRRARHAYITRKKGPCGGRPIIKGTRIKVAQVAKGASPSRSIAPSPTKNWASSSSTTPAGRQSGQVPHGRNRGKRLTDEHQSPK